MPTPLVECIANYSEGRRPEVVTEIRDAITGVTGVTVLDQHSDEDHNRTVITFVGAPEAVEEAAFRSIARAAELIDLNQHTGEHPRIGATDVVPFVPISDVSMAECIEMANRLGRRVGDELGIPVYLYEEAATRLERKNLENIRKGQYEALKAEIESEPAREPDYGPKRVGPAGATVIGARQPLVAFNVYLTTQDQEVAAKIGRAVRHSSGGLRYVKALGMLVEGQAQVSMNLTNFRRTPLAQVVEMIRREAARYGAAVLHSELVGLIPQEALVEAARWYLQLDEFEPDQILERRLASACEQQAGGDLVPVDHAFLDALAAGSATPGGGSASAYSGAAAAGLVEMVANLTIGKKKYAGVEERMQAVRSQAAALRQEFLRAVQRDAASFEAVMGAFKMPKDTPEEKEARSEAIQEATLGATRVPLEVAGLAVQTLELAAEVVESGNANAISDGATGGALARAAFTGAGYNVRINTGSLKDQDTARSLLSKLNELEKQAQQLEARIQSTLRERGNLAF